jgi:hypothetical protein
MFYINYNTTDCENAVITTPVQNNQYIDYVKSLPTPYPVSNIRHYSIEYSINCCTPQTVLLPVRYVFQVSISNCLYDTLNNTLTYSLDITGINNSFVSQTHVNYNNGGYNPITKTAIPNGFKITFVEQNVPTPNINNPIFTTHTLQIKITHVDGFIYTLNTTITMPFNYCPMTSTLVSVNYPPLPSNIVITDLTNDELSLNSLFNKPILEAGVYNIIICEVRNNSTNCLQRSYFVECSIRCDIIDKLVQCRNSDIFNYYDALKYSNECENITYEDKCALYELMYMKLSNQACIDPYEDCNCNGETTAPLFQNRIKPNNNRMGTKNCGCG